MLDIRNLLVVYPNGVEALRSVSLSVRRGEIVALIGRSGAGKSTLLRCINGLQPMTSGAVIVDGADVSRMTRSELADLRCQVGFIRLGYNLVRRLSAFTNVLTGRLGHRRRSSFPALRSLFAPTCRGGDQGVVPEHAGRRGIHQGGQAVVRRFEHREGAGAPQCVLRFHAGHGQAAGPRPAWPQLRAAMTPAPIQETI